jgi:hypothetical protein
MDQQMHRRKLRTLALADRQTKQFETRSLVSAQVYFL